MAVAGLYITAKFWPRTSAATSPGIQTTISNQHQNVRTESMTPMSLFYLPWFSRLKLIPKISCCPPPATPCQKPPIKASVILTFVQHKVISLFCCLWASNASMVLADSYHSKPWINSLCSLVWLVFVHFYKTNLSRDF